MLECISTIIVQNQGISSCMSNACCYFKQKFHGRTSAMHGMNAHNYVLTLLTSNDYFHLNKYVTKHNLLRNSSGVFV